MVFQPEKSGKVKSSDGVFSHLLPIIYIPAVQARKPQIPLAQGSLCLVKFTLNL